MIFWLLFLLVLTYVVVSFCHSCLSWNVSLIKISLYHLFKVSLLLTTYNHDWISSGLITYPTVTSHTSVKTMTENILSKHIPLLTLQDLIYTWDMNCSVSICRINKPCVLPLYSPQFLIGIQKFVLTEKMGWGELLLCRLTTPPNLDSCM
jgi:hypothetical protein